MKRLNSVLAAAAVCTGLAYAPVAGAAELTPRAKVTVTPGRVEVTAVADGADIIDIGGVKAGPGDDVDAAEEIRRETGLPSSIGAGTGKQYAKIGSGRAKPDGVFVIPHDRQLEILHPMPVNALWGVGPVTETKLLAAGIETIGDLARLSEKELDIAIGGAVGKQLWWLARGERERDPLLRAWHRLGTTVASLGDATQGGFWIKTPLVRSNGKGRIVNPATGKSVNVDLLPLSGPASAGSQVSLPALTTLGADLTDLPEVEVYRS